MELPRDSGFWGPAFTFLTALVGSIRWLLRVIFSYRQRTNLHKAKLDADLQKQNYDNTQKTILSLKAVIDQIKPIVEAHSEKLESFNASFEEMKKIETAAVQMMKELKIQYGEFHSRITNANAGGQIVMKKLNHLETEITNLKNGHILIANKKTRDGK